MDRLLNDSHRSEQDSLLLQHDLFTGLLVKLIRHDAKLKDLLDLLKAHNALILELLQRKEAAFQQSDDLLAVFLAALLLLDALQ